jgi:hypothetical protein
MILHRLQPLLSRGSKPTAVTELASGSLARALVACLFCPITVIKTRFEALFCFCCSPL